MEGAEEAHEARLAVVPVGPVMEVATAERNAATGPPRKIGSDGIFRNISDESHPH